MVQQLVAVIDNLDTRTIALVISTVFLSVTGLLLFVYFTRKTYAGFGYWVFWQLCALIGLVLFFSRGAQPAAVMVILNNLFALIAPAFLFHGFARFFGFYENNRLLIWAGYLIALAAVALQSWFLLGHPDQEARAAIFFGARGILLLRCSLEPLRHPAARKSSVFRMVACIGVVLAGNDLRQVWQGFDMQGEADVLASADIKVAMLAAVIGDVVAAYGLLMLSSERLETELRTARQDIETLARTDGLTGLWNRRHLEDILRHEVERARRYRQPVSVMLFDIDGFKSINDQFGHPVGDDVLRRIAALGQRAIRASDIFGRWGGEEFFVLVPSTVVEDARQLAEKLRAAMARHDFGNRTVTASFGVAEWHDDESIESWLQRADAALYAAKEGGRNRVAMAG